MSQPASSPQALDLYAAAGHVAVGAASVTFSLAVCTLVAMRRSRRRPLVIWCILGATTSATLAITFLAVHYLRQWTGNDAALCAAVAKVVPCAYCVTVGFVMQFLHVRASIVDENASSSWLMRLIQVAISGIVPYTILGAIVVTSSIDAELGLCIRYYPVYLPILLTVSALALSSLLMYKFVSAINDHVRIIEIDRATSPQRAMSPSVDYHAIARRNLVASTVAMSCTISTMALIVVADLAFASAAAPDVGAIEDMVGTVDLVVNCLALCTCTTIWMPDELRALLSRVVGAIRTTTPVSVLASASTKLSFGRARPTTDILI